MLEADKGSREKVPNTEAVSDTFLHFYSTVCLKSYCPRYNQTCGHIDQTNAWKSQLKAAGF